MTTDENPPSNKKKIFFRAGPFSFYTQLVLMMILVFFASIGYFRSNLLDHDPLSEGPESIGQNHETSAGGEDPTRLLNPTDRKPIKNLVLKAADGTTVQLKNFLNKVVILSFWASDCAPCLEELPTFAKLQRELGSDKLAIVPVNVEDENSLDRNFINAIWKKNQLPFQTFYDPQQINAEIMDIQVTPTNYVLDKNGRIAFSSFGYNNWASTKALGLIKALIDEPN